MDKLFSIKEVAGYLGVSEHTVRRMIQRGELPASKVGGQWRIEPEALNLYLKKQASFIGNLRLNQLYFREAVLQQYRNNSRYYIQEEGSRGRLGLKEDRSLLHSVKSLKHLFTKEKKDKIESLDKVYKEGLFSEMYFWRVKLKSGEMAVMVDPKYFYKLPDAEQKKWMLYAIPNPQI